MNVYAMLKAAREAKVLKDKLKKVEERLEIAELNLKTEMEKSAILDATPLPKCESLACVRCEHIVYQKIGGRVFVLGCGKNLTCEHFKASSFPPDEQMRHALEDRIIKA